MVMATARKPTRDIDNIQITRTFLPAPVVIAEEITERLAAASTAAQQLVDSLAPTEKQ
jgi:hypothetical protein